MALFHNKWKCPCLKCSEARMNESMRHITDLHHETSTEAVQEAVRKANEIIARHSPPKGGMTPLEFKRAMTIETQSELP